MTVVLPHHVLDRMTARTNFSPTRAQEIAEEAYYCGRDIEDFKEKQMRRYLKNVLEGSTGDVLKVMGNDIYLFGNGCLITIFPIPQKLITLVHKKAKRREYGSQD